MEKISQQQNDLLLNYLDGTLSGAEVTLLKKRLEESAALQQRLDEIRLVHTFLATKNPQASLSSDFTERVMSGLHRTPASLPSMSPRNGIVLLCGILVATAIGITLLATGYFDGMNAPISFENLNVPDKIISLTVDHVPFNVKLMMRVLIIINIGLALVVLDRTVLKPYFARRHRSQSFS